MVDDRTFQNASSEQLSVISWDVSYWTKALGSTPFQKASKSYTEKVGSDLC